MLPGRQPPIGFFHMAPWSLGIRNGRGEPFLILDSLSAFHPYLDLGKGAERRKSIPRKTRKD